MNAPDSTLRPSAVRLRRQSRVVELEYADGEQYSLDWEYLRVQSPSAEVRGHHPSQAVLQTGKKNVAVTELRPVGHYALQIVFDDGHDTGLYSWEYLHALCREREQRWADYLAALDKAGASRDPDEQVLHFQP
jgi:DUF971 family protein